MKKKVPTNTYQKQENNNIYPSFEKIVDYVALKVSDAVKKNEKGISFLSSYIDKVMYHEEKNALFEVQKGYQARLKRKRAQLQTVNVPGFDWLETI